MKTICIAGKNDIAVNVLLHCIHNYPDIRLKVVCNRNEPGINGWQKSLKWFAKKENIEICDLEDVYDIENLIFLSLEFDRILRPENFRTKQIFNIHFSLLPKYKGCHTSVLPILNQEKETGVTFHKVDRGIDTGEIVDSKVVEILQFDTSYDLYKKLIVAGTDVVIRNLQNVIHGKVDSYPQSCKYSTYFSSSTIDYKNAHLNVNCTAYQIQNQVRAFSFRPYQLLDWNGVNIIECIILNERSTKTPGTILEETHTYIKASSVDFDVILFKDTLSELLQKIKSNQNNEDCIELCISNAVINAQNKYGWTPLIVATYNGNTEMVRYLIERKADIHAVNNNGTTILMYAKDAGLRTNNWDIFSLYVELGLNVHARDYDGREITDYLSKYEIMQLPKKIRDILAI